MRDPEEILVNSSRILLVDWPSTSVPRTLLAKGFTVFSYSPDKYSQASVVSDPPPDVDGLSVFPPTGETETGYLVFRRLDEPPDKVDIVNVYRPAEELPGIIKRHVLPLSAKVVWLQLPNKSKSGADIAEAHGLDFVEGVDIAEAASRLDARRQ